jgi:hypothetical protein
LVPHSAAAADADAAAFAVDAPPPASVFFGGSACPAEVTALAAAVSAGAAEALAAALADGGAEGRASGLDALAAAAFSAGALVSDSDFVQPANDARLRAARRR